MTDTLTFYVQGSAKEPYRIMAEGAGATFRAFCNCPAGRKGTFCKHIAYLLQGDVTKLAPSSDALVHELTRRAQGSPILDKAGKRIDKDVRVSESVGLSSLSDVFAKFSAELERLGWAIVFKGNEGERDEDRIELYVAFKNGTLRKTPSLTFEYVRNDYGIDGAQYWQQEDHEVPVTLRARERPFGIRAKGGRSVGNAWKHLPEALAVFLELARRGPH